MKVDEVEKQYAFLLRIHFQIYTLEEENVRYIIFSIEKPNKKKKWK